MSEKTEEKVVVKPDRSTINSNGKNKYSEPPQVEDSNNQGEVESASPEKEIDSNQSQAEDENSAKDAAPPKKKKSKLPFMIGGVIVKRKPTRRIK